MAKLARPRSGVRLVTCKLRAYSLCATATPGELPLLTLTLDHIGFSDELRALEDAHERGYTKLILLVETGEQLDDEEETDDG
jgi:hypothetical protein